MLYLYKVFRINRLFKYFIVQPKCIKCGVQLHNARGQQPNLGVWIYNSIIQGASKKLELNNLCCD